MENISHKSCRGKQNTFYLQDPFPENRAAYENVKKKDRDRQATDDNIMRRRKDAICMQDN